MSKRGSASVTYNFILLDMNVNIRVAFLTPMSVPHWLFCWQIKDTPIKVGAFADIFSLFTYKRKQQGGHGLSVQGRNEGFSFFTGSIPEVPV